MGNLYYLMLIFGALVGTITINFEPTVTILCCTLGAVIFGFSIYCTKSVFGGVIWGRKISSPAILTIMRIFSVFGMFVGGFSCMTVVIYGFFMLFDDFVTGLIYLALMLVVTIVSILVTSKITTKVVAKSKHAISLGELEIFKEIDSTINQAQKFVVSFEGVALMNSANYCFALYRYDDYQLGELSLPNEVALVGTYFVQKYNDLFKFKVDMEVIPGEPGQTAVAFGTGGIAIAHTSGTKDKRLFRSYIFTKR